MIQNTTQYERIGLATEKPDILTGLPLNNSGAITGDSKMSKRIPLTQGKFAIVDDEDYERLSRFKWYTGKSRNTFYAVRSVKIMGKWITRKMDRDILNVPIGFQVDHINRNGLDNRKVNLRTCTLAQNVRNRKTPKHSSKYKGVSWFKITKKWRAYIYPNNKFISLGYFMNEIDAAKAYDNKAKELFGEFACLNF